MRIGLAAVALAMAASPSALAAEKPAPDALWQAFPLDPARGRPAAPLLPPAQGQSEAATVTEATTVTDTPSEASRPSVVVLAFAALLLLLATVSVLSGRRLYVNRRHRSASMPLWQGVTWPRSPHGAQELGESPVKTSSALVGVERRAVEPHPDVLAPRYRWADEAPARRSRPSLGMEILAMIHRVRSVVWTEDVAPALIGAAVAVVAGILLVYLVG